MQTSEPLFMAVYSIPLRLLTYSAIESLLNNSLLIFLLHSDTKRQSELTLLIVQL